MRSIDFENNTVADQIRNAFNISAASYGKKMYIFYPTVGSRGITEANQVAEFCKQFELLTNNKAVSYLEVPFGGSERLDGIIVNTDEKEPYIILIEAKRIKEGGYNHAIKEIRRDAMRLDSQYGLSTLPERVVCKSVIEHIRIYNVFIADVWVGNIDRSKTILAEWEKPTILDDWHNGYFANCQAYTAPDSGTKYHLLLAIKPTTNALTTSA